jgi:hypothetical protein
MRGIKIRKNEMDMACNIWDRKGACRVVIGKSEEKRPLGTRRNRWDKIKVYLK